MRKEFVNIFAIFFGILIIALPVLGIVAAKDLLGLSILLISIFLLVLGVAGIDYKKWGAILYIILGIIMLLFSIGLIFKPELFSSLAEILFYATGIFLIIIGVISLINNRTSKYGFIIGIVAILIGVIYIIIGSLVSDPIILGYLLGIWLVITGVLRIADR
ncbi:MAG: DUF308 domain-containing protein [archaeon]|nr:DUF308 domain-containing protein [archaeon]